MNGYKVNKVLTDKNGKITDICFLEENEEQLYSIGEIKSIVTKEQFSSLEYKI